MSKPNEQNYEYDLLVIGGGSGGVRAARMAAATAARVGIIEDRYWGGTCVNVGCVPKKLYYYASHFTENFHDAAGFGWQVGATKFNWDSLKDNRRTEISRLNGIYVNLLSHAGVAIINGRGVIAGPNTVTVGEQQLSADKILVAVGGWPYIPEFTGSDLAISSNEVFDMAELPATMVIVGGGYIAVEFACIFAGLGVNVHLVYRGSQLLKQVDADLGAFILTELQHKDIKVLLNTNITAITAGDTRKLVTLDNGDSINADQILYATGRKPAVAGLGLLEQGVEQLPNGKLLVDEWFQTSVPSLFALGDITPGPELTPVALAEGMTFVRHWYEGSNKPLDYDNIPTAIFTQPNIATVGLTEREARDRYANIEIYKSDFKHLKHTLTDNKSRTMMKLVVDADTQKVVGAHMVGDDAGEIIQGLAVAIKAGATKQVFDETIGIHPTAAEEFVTMRVPV